MPHRPGDGVHEEVDQSIVARYWLEQPGQPVRKVPDPMPHIVPEFWLEALAPELPELAVLVGDGVGLQSEDAHTDHVRRILSREVVAFVHFVSFDDSIEIANKLLGALDDEVEHLFQLCRGEDGRELVAHRPPTLWVEVDEVLGQWVDVPVDANAPVGERPETLH